MTLPKHGKRGTLLFPHTFLKGRRKLEQLRLSCDLKKLKLPRHLDCHNNANAELIVSNY